MVYFSYLRSQARIRIYRDSANLSPLPLLGRFVHHTLCDCHLAARAVLGRGGSRTHLVNQGALPAMIERKETIDKLDLCCYKENC